MESVIHNNKQYLSLCFHSPPPSIILLTFSLRLSLFGVFLCMILEIISLIDFIVYRFVTFKVIVCFACLCSKENYQRSGEEETEQDNSDKI